MGKIPGRPNKAADDWLDAFRVQTRNANTTILAVALSLVLGWFTVIEPTYQEFERVVHENESTTDTRLEKFRTALVDIVLRRVNAERQPLVGDAEPSATTLSEAPSASSGEEAPKSDLPQVDGGTVEFLLNARDEEMRAYDRLSSQIAASAELEAKLKQNAVFELLGAKFPIPKTLVVLSWISILAGLIAYVGMRRNTLSGTLLKAKGEFERTVAAAPQGDGQPVEFVDFAGEAPFWLAPIASLRPRVGDSDDVRDALGWSADDERNSLVITYAALLVLGLVLVRVAWIGFMVTDDYKPAADAAGYPPILGLRLIPLLSDLTVSALIVVIVALVLRHLLPARYPDAFFKPGRRGTLELVGLAAIATVGTLLIGTDAANWKYTHTRDRFKRRNKDPQPWQALALGQGFYRFTGAKTPEQTDRPVLYATAWAKDGTPGSWAPANSKIEDFVLVPATAAATDLAGSDVLRRRRWASFVELAAMDAVEAGRKLEAITLLDQAITKDLAHSGDLARILARPLASPMRQFTVPLVPTIQPDTPASSQTSQAQALTQLPPIDTTLARRLTDTLLLSMRRRHHPYRLYDLLALLLATEDDDFELLGGLCTRIKASASQYDPLFPRADKWLQANGAWRARLTNTKYPVVWTCPLPSGLKKITVRA